MSPTLASLIAATDGIHARDPSTLDRLDASTASKRTPSSVVAACAFETSFFETHVAYAVERDDEREDGEGVRDANVCADAADDAEVVHVFTLKDKVRERLTRALTPLALRKFRRGREDEARSLGGAVPGPGSDVSVVRSNRGGYQSYADLLDSDSEDEVSDAVDDKDDVPNHPPSWTVVNAIALEAYARVKRDSQRDDVTARDVYGWLNVNAPGDYNKLHAHDSADRWSGVLYLATPSATTTTTTIDDDDDDDERDERDAGALGIRGNTTARPHHTGTDSTRERDAERASAAASTTPYFVHAPTPGDLVVFTGAALHAVAPFHATTKTTNADPPDGYDVGPSDDVLRVSVAFNVDC